MATTLDEAIAGVLRGRSPLGVETIAASDAPGRVLADPVVAPLPIPPFTNSAMDGYAVRAADTARAPVVLPLCGDARAGLPLGSALAPGSCARISTGAMVPAGADAIVRVEDTSPSGDASVAVGVTVEPGTDVRPEGDDVSAGTTLVLAGTVLRAGDLAAAAAAGCESVSVFRRPRVAVVGTGDELVPPGEPLGPGQIHDSNTPMLCALVTEAGGEVVAVYTRIADDREETRAAIAEAIEAADLVLLSGGVSMGVHDHVRPALGELGATERFWQVAIRPGHPTWFGVAADGTPVLGLPGNPASAYSIFRLLGARLIAALGGRSGEPLRLEAVYRGPDVRKREGMVQALRVSLATGEDGRPVARPAGSGQRSHAISSLAGVDALALVAADVTTLRDGDPLTVECARSSV
ncbi:MAG: gephyrin-like molybdotransferase Glp [Baekduia sp.]